MRFLGVGPGRCGTQSLANVLGARHEEHRFPWVPDDESTKMARCLAHDKEAYVGWTYLSHVQILRQYRPLLPIICIHRSRKDTVISHARICSGMDRISLLGRTIMGPTKLNAAYPELDVEPGARAWGVWFDLVEDMMFQIPAPKFDFHMPGLNSDYDLGILCDWLRDQDALPAGHKIPENRRWDKHGAEGEIKIDLQGTGALPGQQRLV